MRNNCGGCLHGKEFKPGGKKPSPGTVWCSTRSLQMGRNRVLSCFKPKGGAKTGRCMNCKWASIMKPSGETPAVGHVWCKKKHIEIHKHRNMGCFAQK